jgi:hypothetical protein
LRQEESAMCETELSQRGRIRWQRLFVILMVLFGMAVTAAVPTWMWLSKRHVEDCIAALERAGAEVQYGVASERYYISVPPTFDDEQLKAIIPYIKGLEPLESLSLYNTQISDASIDLLTHCRIRALHIRRTKISAEGAARLQRELRAWVVHESLQH